jgi:sirohydrochlorin cobaltochelatase
MSQQQELKTERSLKGLDEAVLLMAHGSRDAEGAAEFLAFARRLAMLLAQPIYPGFLELAEPSIAVAITQAVDAGARTIIAVPWLLLGAGHVKNDLPAAIHWARDRFPGVQFRYGTPIGVQPELLAVLGDRLAAIDPDGGCGSPETALLLVERGSSDPQANADVYRVARLLWEDRNFGTAEVAFVGITRPSVPEGLERCVALGARRVLVLPYFLYTGVLLKRIATFVAAAAALHPAVEFRVAQHLGQDTRLETLALRLIEQARTGQATMTCDVCQYRVPLFGREARVGMPPWSDHAHGLRGTTTGNHTATDTFPAHTHGHDSPMHCHCISHDHGQQ